MHGIIKKLRQTHVRKPGGKRPFGRPRGGWEDEMKIDIKQIDLEVLTA
jgi:hypothetical protein